MALSPPSDLLIKLLSPKASVPQKMTSGAVGYDLFSSQALNIKSGQHELVLTDLSILPPEGCYARIASRSGLALNKGVHVGAGVIAEAKGKLGRGRAGVAHFPKWATKSRK